MTYHQNRIGVVYIGSLVFCCIAVEMNKALLILMTVAYGKLADNSPIGINLRSLPVIPAIACAMFRPYQESDWWFGTPY